MKLVFMLSGIVTSRLKGISRLLYDSSVLSIGSMFLMMKLGSIVIFWLLSIDCRCCDVMGLVKVFDSGVV